MILLVDVICLVSTVFGVGWLAVWLLDLQTLSVYLTWRNYFASIFILTGLFIVLIFCKHIFRRIF